jgi:mersacidin/lichenicidin family type 2 lantibiotic
MHKTEIVRAWKDPLYRASLSPEELAQVPAHPAGVVELRDDQLKRASGGVLTTAFDCTDFTFRNWRACCP